MADAELLQNIAGQLRNCAGWDDDIIAADRKRALDAYHMRPRGDEIAGRSNVVAGDISAMVESNAAQMLEAFTSDNIVDFRPFGETDIEQAQLESQAVVDMVMGDNNGFLVFGAGIKDCLLQRNGFGKVWVEDWERSKTMRFTNFQPEVLAELDARENVEAEVISWDEEAETASVRVTITGQRFHVDPVALENFFYPRDWHTLDLQEIPFCAERHIEPRWKLIDRGFPKRIVNNLAPYHSPHTEQELSRNVGGYAAHHIALDKSQELVQWFECHVIVGGQGGKPERRTISIAGKSLQSELDDEPSELVPYFAGACLINPHRLTGISLFDKLQQNWDVATALERALLDNINTVIKNRLFYIDGKVNVDDLSDGRPDGNVRVRRSVQDIRSVAMAIQQADLTQGLLANIQDNRQQRSEMGGASLELATGNMQLNERIGSEGVDRAYSVMEQLAAHMTKTVASTLIRSAMLLAHATLRKHWLGEITTERGGRWNFTKPSQWPERTRVTIKVGMSPGERSRKVAALTGVIESQLKLGELQLDDVLFDIEGFYQALMDRARAQDLPNPEQYYVDPQSDASKSALKRKQDSEAKMGEMQRNLMQQAVGLEQLREAIDKYKHDTELQFKYWERVLGSEETEAKITGEATTRLLEARAKGEQESDEAGEGGEPKPRGKANGRDSAAAAE